jgi:hypothetical protein
LTVPLPPETGHMISERHRRVSRANARLTTDPEAPAGEARSARNARRHGLSVSRASDHRIAIAADDLGCRSAVIKRWRGEKSVRLQWMCRNQCAP